MNAQTRRDLVEAYNRIADNIWYAGERAEMCEYGSAEWHSWRMAEIDYQGQQIGILIALALLKSPSAPCGYIPDKTGWREHSRASGIRLRQGELTPEAVRLLSEEQEQ